MELTSQTIGAAAGWIGVLWIAIQSALLAVRTLRRHTADRRTLNERRTAFRRRVEAAARTARAEKAIPDWEGWRSFRVAAIIDEARDVKSLYFVPVDARPLAPFSPGQYLTFRLPIADHAPPLVRCYSLSDRPRDDFYRCTIKRLGPPPVRAELPAGRGSNYIHDVVKVGDVLEVRAPGGTFFVDPHSSQPIVLIGAGIGVTPLVSMVEAVVHAGLIRDVYVLLGFHNGEEHPFKELLKQVAQQHRHVHLHISYSAPRKTDTLYRDYNHLGRMTIERVRAILPSNNYQFYVCGPGGMMESLVPALWSWGVPESHVHFEAFGPASVKRVRGGATVQANLSPCEVRFERSSRSIRWDGTLGTLLELAEAASIPLVSGCRAGSCGECMIAVRAGTVKSLKRPGINVPTGHCLTCISVPEGDLTLEA